MAVELRNDVWSTRSEGENDLERFARAFKNEIELHQHVATLLRKMGREDVTITHGTSEKGKDIIFYGDGGLGERSLYACVIKKERITGNLNSRTSAKNVLQQAELAFDEPYINPSNGAEERVKAVYIISPYDSPPATIESIRSSLLKSGQVEFFCGIRLMGLFAKHWSSFLLFDSSVLVSYLSALRSGLGGDNPLLELIVRRGILADTPAHFKEMYVPQLFSQQLSPVKVRDWLQSGITVPTRKLKLAEISGLCAQFERLRDVANYIRDCGNGTAPWPEDINPATEISDFTAAVLRAWKKSYQYYVAERQREWQKNRPRKGTAFGFTVDSERTASVAITVTDDLRQLQERVENIRQLVVERVSRDSRVVTEGVVKNEPTSPLWLHNPEMVSHCRLLDLEETVPGTLNFDSSITKLLSFEADFLSGDIKIVLLSGPAGFGKTSFCKWQALQAVDLLLQKQGDILPVFVSLSQFANKSPQTVDQAFLDSADLQHLLSQSNNKTRIRLFLDGLDEIPIMIGSGE